MFPAYRRTPQVEAVERLPPEDHREVRHRLLPVVEDLDVMNLRGRGCEVSEPNQVPVQRHERIAGVPPGHPFVPGRAFGRNRLGSRQADVCQRGRRGRRRRLHCATAGSTGEVVLGFEIIRLLPPGPSFGPVPAQAIPRPARTARSPAVDRSARIRADLCLDGLPDPLRNGHVPRVPIAAAAEGLVEILPQILPRP